MHTRVVPTDVVHRINLMFPTCNAAVRSLEKALLNAYLDWLENQNKSLPSSFLLMTPTYFLGHTQVTIMQFTPFFAMDR
jgi:hypothetical protein